MKGWNQSSKKKRNGNGNGEKSKIKQSACICLLFELPLQKRINVLAIDTSEELRIFPLSPLKHASSTSRVGFASLGSKIFVLGGDIDRETRNYPREVYIWDFNCNEKQWKKGPPLNAKKPNPVVVTVNKKIYALAGDSIFDRRKTETIGHVFEVLDPELGNVWTPLPNPPFHSLYKKSSGVEFRGHTVIGLNIYVLLLHSYNRVTLYSFNVIENKWKMHNGGDSSGAACAGSDDMILHNLSVGPWFFEAEVVDYLLYQTIFDQPGKVMKVYAYDLTAGQEDEEQETEEEAETFDDDPLPDDYSLVTVPIFGLSHVTDTVTASKSTLAFVVHLRNNVFCLVCIYTSCNAGGRARHVRACVFQVDSVELLEGTEFTKRYLVAENVTQADWIIDSGPKLGIFSARCNLDGLNFQVHAIFVNIYSCIEVSRLVTWFVGTPSLTKSLGWPLMGHKLSNLTSFGTCKFFMFQFSVRHSMFVALKVNCTLVYFTC
ncbi:uncharacterized protein LOC114291068 isoform X2 [Camellia sinensis]|nr:uncharacterized protein LOC114291068 isoform X2 [Camellia sinensis]XP_028090896.1 uncharacterized protein LOC114291068 isoform X2 [Camellia sinensis]XP_028090897.1 uncharacterized protein LOC114291068 isoform X2 [Camellia sinensis]